MNDGEADVIHGFKKEISFAPYFDGLKNGFEFPGLSDFPQKNGQFYAPRQFPDP